MSSKIFLSRHSNGSSWTMGNILLVSQHVGNCCSFLVVIISIRSASHLCTAGCLMRSGLELNYNLCIIFFSLPNDELFKVDILMKISRPSSLYLVLHKLSFTSLRISLGEMSMLIHCEIFIIWHDENMFEKSSIVMSVIYQIY